MKDLKLNESSIDVSVTDNSNSGEVRTEQIGNTPFVKVSSDNDGFIALGQYRLTDSTTGEELDSIEEEIKNMNWKFMIAVIGAITKQTVETYKSEL